MDLALDLEMHLQVDLAVYLGHLANFSLSPISTFRILRIARIYIVGNRMCLQNSGWVDAKLKAVSQYVS